jgi:hypothetical protein
MAQEARLLRLLSNKKYFGAKWFEFTEKEQEDIWHVLYFFDSKSNLKEYAIKNWNFTEEQAESISKFNVKDGYASLSRKAISNILPFLKLGFTYDVALKSKVGMVFQNYNLFPHLSVRENVSLTFFMFIF